MRNRQCHGGVLLDQQNGDARLVDRTDVFQNLFDELRRQAHGRFVEEQKFRLGHEPTADREHLLFATRESTRILLLPLF